MTGGTALSAIASLRLSAESACLAKPQQSQNGGSSPYPAGCDVANGEAFRLPHSGLCCQHCGEQLTRVNHTRTTAGFILRERICPRCDRINTTSERILSVRVRKRTFSDPCE